MKKHGMSNTPTYDVWARMKARCQNPASTKFGVYGLRGIKVCERWQCFENFYADMGERPIGLSLDRIDTNGNYEPGNCRWASQREQQRNRTNNKLTLESARQIVHLAKSGVTQKSAAAIMGVSPPLVRDILSGRCWPEAAAPAAGREKGK